MKNLKSLIQLLTPNKIRQIRVLDSNLNRDTKLMQLYAGIHSEQFQNDAEAIQALYGNKPTGSKYSKLKNDLESRLLNLLIVSDQANSKMNERQKAFFKYFKTWAAAVLLIKLGRTKNGIRLLERSLKHFEKHEFTFLALETV